MKTNPTPYAFFTADDPEPIFESILIPKVLMDKERYPISIEAKCLYGLLLDRMELSQHNNWLDEDGHTYVIYTIAETMKAIGVSRTTACKYFVDLEEVGLITRRRLRHGTASRIAIFLTELEPS